MLHYITTLNLIRLTIKHKKTSVKIMQTKKTKRLLIILIKLNIVFGWTDLFIKNKHYYNVYVNSFFYKKIVTLIKPSKQLVLNHKQIKNYNTSLNNLSIILTTNKGLLNLSESFDKKCGGVLLFCLV